MITNQVMKRPMGNFLVEQRTKDSMFNATNLLKQWNEASGEKKEITKFFDNDNTKEFISALMEEEKLNTQNSAYLKARGKNGGTWMHPILFVKFAMWLNPRFDVSLYKDLMQSIEIQRSEFQTSQERMLDIIREHETLVKTYPAKWFISDAKPIEYKVISSSKTKMIMQLGEDNDVDLFKK